METTFYAFLAINWPQIVASAVLLVISATFSGCETSLFSLDPPQINYIRKSASRVDRSLAQLLENLKGFLPTILFANMAINILFFALSSSITSRISRDFGAAPAVLYSMVALFGVVLFGEVFPKQLAIASSITVARLTGVPVWYVCRVLSKPLRALNAIVTGLERAVDPGRPDSHELREEELKLLVEVSKTDGVISQGEYELIDGVVDLPDVKVRDIMVPRVDVRSVAAQSMVPPVLEAARSVGHCKLPVMNDEDEPIGWVDVRQLYTVDGSDPADGAPVEIYARPLRFFSEHDRVDQVLEKIKKRDTELYAVVDERGQIIGFFTMQDVMDEILGHFGEYGSPPPTEIREHNGTYIISGQFSVREWREFFNVSTEFPRSATVGGLVVAMLGRIARPGDVVTLENMELTVLSTWHNRVTEVALRLILPSLQSQEIDDVTRVEGTEC